MPPKFLCRGKAWAKPFGCQASSTGFPPEGLPVVGQSGQAVSGVRAPPPPLGPGLPEIAPLCQLEARGADTHVSLFTLSGYRRACCRSPRSDKALPPPPHGLLFCAHRLKA